HTTGWRSSCAKPGERQDLSDCCTHADPVHALQPPSSLCFVALTKVANSPRVTAKRPTANGLPIDTRTCESSLNRVGSFAGDPITKLPTGTTTISRNASTRD